MADISEVMDIGTAERLFGFHGAYTREELSAAYRKAIRDNHPDFAKDDADKEARTRKSAAINAAYRKLMPLFSGKPSGYRMACSPEKGTASNSTGAAHATSGATRTATGSTARADSNATGKAAGNGTAGQGKGATARRSRPQGRAAGTGTSGAAGNVSGTGKEQAQGKTSRSGSKSSSKRKKTAAGKGSRNERGKGKGRKTPATTQPSGSEDSAGFDAFYASAVKRAVDSAGSRAGSGAPVTTPGAESPDPKLVAEYLRRTKMKKAVPEWMGRNEGLRRTIRTVMLVVFAFVGFLGGTLGLPSAVANAGFIALVVEGLSGLISKCAFKWVANRVVGKAIDLSDGRS